MNNTEKCFQTELLQTEEGQFWFSVQPLRLLYVTNNTLFHQIMTLFRIFGIEVHVSKAQGIFGTWQWRRGWHVVTGIEKVDWLHIQHSVARDPVLSAMPAVVSECISNRNIYGMVIEQVAALNPLLEAKSLENSLAGLGVVLSTWPVSDKAKSEPVVSVDQHDLEKFRIPMDRVFYADQDAEILRLLDQIGIKYLDEITFSKLGQLLRLKGVNARQIEYIQQRITQFNLIQSALAGLKQLGRVRGAGVRTPIEDFFDSDHDVLIIKRLKDAGIYYADQANTEKLDIVRKSRGIGREKFKKILNKFISAEKSGYTTVQSSGGGQLDSLNDSDMSGSGQDADEREKVAIETLFPPAHNATVLNSLRHAGINFASDATPERLDKVRHSRGIGIKRFETIRHSLESAKQPVQTDGTSNCENFVDKLEDDLNSGPAQPLKDALIVQGLQSVQEIMPSNIARLSADVWADGYTRRFVDKNYRQLARKLPDEQVMTRLLPLAVELYADYYATAAPRTISLKKYLFLIAEIQCLPKSKQKLFSPWHLLQDHLADFETLVQNSDTRVDVDETRLRICIHASHINVDGLDPSVVKYTWWVYQHLLSDDLNSIIGAYTKQIDTRQSIVVAKRLQSTTPMTLEEISKQLGGTREGIRQIQNKAVKQFIAWWGKMQLTFKLPFTDDQTPLQLEHLFSRPVGLLIANTVAADGQPLAEFLISSERLQKSALELLNPLMVNCIWIKQEQLDRKLSDNKIYLDLDTLKSVMSHFSFIQSPQPDLWVKNKGVTRGDIIRLYMKVHKFETIEVTESGFEQIDQWTQKVFGRPLTMSFRSFSAVMHDMTDMIPIHNGLYRKLDLKNYDKKVFERGRELLKAHFAQGYRFARDKWVMERLAKQLPNDMSSDEFYQVFKILFPDDFKYATGRNNDIYPLNGEQLTITDQIALVVRDQVDGVSVDQLRQDYGWEFYTIQQAAASNNALVIEGNRVSSINLRAANMLLKQPLTTIVENALDREPIIPVAQIYQAYNQLGFSNPNLFEETNITTQARLATYLKTLGLNIDIISGLFLIRKGVLPNVERKPYDVWKEYLSNIASRPKTEEQLKKEVINSVGVSNSTWDQIHVSLFEQAKVVSVSKDRYLAIRVIPRTGEIDAAVNNVLLSYLEDHDYLAIQAIDPAILAKLPNLVGLDLVWTPELFASYATLLGYRRLQWPRRMLQLNYDAIVKPSSSYRTMPDLMANLLDEWRRQNDNDTNLYQRAVKAKLLPPRDSIDKQHLPPDFYEEQGYCVDELGHVRRK